MTNEFVDGGTEVDGPVAEALVVSRRGEDGKVFRDQVAREEVIEAGMMQAERADRVRDDLRDIVRGGEGACERVVQRAPGTFPSSAASEFGSS